MKRFYFVFYLLVLSGLSSCGQNYNSYFTGNNTDIQTSPFGGVVLMGGATEDDNAMSWFLQQANGGDVLVLRASGSDGYNDYLFSQLGVSVNSVETIVFNDATASNEAYIHQKIQNAEAIWFAGGDQWNYISFWRNNTINTLINEAITNRNIVIGGTSAGMAIQGGFYFSAQNGTVTSSTALANPYDNNVTVDGAPFLSNQYLENVITDTHYDNPDRKGRHLVFLARIFVDNNIRAKGIACDEYTAVCIDNNGIAKVYGGHPNFDDNAYFIQPNCDLTNLTPENCSVNNPLDWNLGNQAIKVYAVKGTTTGSNTFDLKDWRTGNGGNWEHWYVDNGVLNEEAGTQPICSSLSIDEYEESSSFDLFPNPSSNLVSIDLKDKSIILNSIKIINHLGQVLKELDISDEEKIEFSVNDLSNGIYFVQVTDINQKISHKKLIKK